MFDCPFWDARATRYGKQIIVRIPARIIVGCGIVPGSVVRVRFVAIVGDSWDSPRPRTIMNNSMVLDSPCAPVLDPDGMTWTARTVGYGSGRVAVRVPCDIVRLHGILSGIVVRLSIVDVVS